MPRLIRNIAIIAHVDHGKTTLVDKLLQQTGTFAAHERVVERVMDSNDLERERGITILAKNCAIEHAGVRINIVDTPGHRDFGGEVERVLGMVDGVLLLVDAVEGPMPQTRFVTKKALAQGLAPIVVINKVDRLNARSDWVINKTFDLFDNLGASEHQLDFPVVYASALEGWASNKPDTREPDMKALLDTILARVPAPTDEGIDGPLQFQVSALNYSSYVGRIAVGRIRRGRIRPGSDVAVMHGEKLLSKARIGLVYAMKGLERATIDEAAAGDIVLVTGLEGIEIGNTICAVDAQQGLPPLAVDEPTLTMSFQVNSSPYAGSEGKFVTSRQIRERLNRELHTNVALRVEETADADIFMVSGRGELHLTILIENMRREGYELAVGRPRVITRTINGVLCEPYESLTLDVEQPHQGAVMESLGWRRGDLVDMVPDGKGRVRLEYRIPARGLIGFQNEFLNATRGTGVMNHLFEDYDKWKGDIPGRTNGVLVSAIQGDAVAYALWFLQDRGRLFVSPGERLYEGMLVGIHSRDSDLVVNPIKEKKLTNVRASGKDEHIVLTPPVQITLEYAVEFIQDDELVEVTPKSIRMRKRHLLAHERKRAARTVETEA
ncbi:MAG: translational GTPase TypA [Burkholderiales bacterium]